MGFRRILFFIRSRKWLTKAIFGVSIPRGESVMLWDFTTLVLYYSTLKFAARNDHILDVGTGAYGIIPIALYSKGYKKVNALDIVPQFVNNANKTAGYNGITLNAFCSDLFSNCRKMYDIIIFNSVYIPTKTGVRLNIGRYKELDNEIFDETWDGGSDGLDTISRFISDAGDYLTATGKILLGYNTYYIKTPVIAAEAAKYGFEVNKNISQLYNPSKVAVLTKKYE